MGRPVPRRCDGGANRRDAGSGDDAYGGGVGRRRKLPAHLGGILIGIHSHEQVPVLASILTRAAAPAARRSESRT
jgi:hypothetical protein